MLQHQLAAAWESRGVWYSRRGCDLPADRYVVVNAASHAVRQRQNLSALPGDALILPPCSATAVTYAGFRNAGVLYYILTT